MLDHLMQAMQDLDHAEASVAPHLLKVAGLYTTTKSFG